MRLGQLLGVLLLTVTVLMGASDTVANAKVRTLAPAKVERGYASFKLKGVAPWKIRSASLRMRGYRRALRLAKVRQAARRGVLRVRVSPTGRRATARARRRKPKLVLTLSGGQRGSPNSTASGATTRSAGTAPLSDAEAAAHVRRSAFEPRAQNATANERVPSALQLPLFRIASAGTLSGLQLDKVTGNFRGTTDEIIQWAAWKWGFDEDVFRAVAAVESWWVQGFVGDAGKSFGLMQIKVTDYPGTQPLSTQSTAFNVDYYGALMRYYYDGKATWLNDPCCLSGTTYAAGDLWGSIGAHYSGRWHTASSVEYANKVKDYLAKRSWAERGF